MIHTDSRSLEWINHVAEQHPGLDKQLIEKTIRAFSLLESLVRSGCPFVFKGGTACMLHLNSSRRLSIDIDIICPPGTDITKYLDVYAKEYGFTNSQLKNRLSANNVPKSHCKFFYEVTYVTSGTEDSILLDVLFEDIHYANVVQLPISSPFLKMEGETFMVNVPSASDILGDKLTAFAPHTTGVPFYKGTKNSSMEIIKQMYDIASLMDIVPDLTQTLETFNKFAEVELGYRNLENTTTKEILQDAIDTALCISLRGLYNPDEYTLLQGGIKRIKSIILSEPYVLDYAIRDAAKAAYIAALALHEKTEMERYDPTKAAATAEMTIGKVLNSKLNKLKRTHSEAFYYWAQVDKLLASCQNEEQNAHLPENQP
ncbi:MAG: nucleotidyl transferase AbiEii/AbiGii toxin family protein [Prevotella sp.]|nr:nucleotidyl transferase AbiEii/AbiGii toxin family protein [Prevotella sp.]